MTSSSQAKGLSVNWVFVALLAIVLTFAAWQIRNILLLTLAAVILVVFFTSPVRLLTRRFGLSRSVAILITLVGFIVILVALSLLVFPTLIEQFSVLATEIIPAGVDRLVEWWNNGGIYETMPFLEGAFDEFVIDEQLINQIIGPISGALGSLGGSVIPFVGGLANTIVSLLVILFLTLYFLSEPDRYIGGIITLTPVWYRPRMETVLYKIDETLRAYLRVTGVSMLVTGVGTGIGLALLGIQQWAALAVLAGIFSFIPNFGPILALIPAVAVGMVQVPDSILLIILIVYGVSFIQSQLVAPILASEGMNLAPVLILAGQIVFGIFFGFMGILLAVPITAMGKVLVDEIYVKDVLGDVPVVEDTAPYEDDLMPDGV